MRRRPVPPPPRPSRDSITAGPSATDRCLHAPSYYTKLLASANGRTLQQNDDLVRWLLETHPVVHATLTSWAVRGSVDMTALVAMTTMQTHAAGAAIVAQDVTPAGSLFVVATGSCTEYVRPHRFGHSRRKRQMPARSWRTLTPGQSFGLDALYYQFEFHYVTVASNGHIERSAIGLPTNTPALIFALTPATPTDVALIASLVPTSPPFPYDAHVLRCLQATFLFAGLATPALEFVAGHVPPLLAVPRGEYLFTAGQPTGIYLVASGELRVYTIDNVVLVQSEDRHVATRRVELQILRPMDVAGLSESCTGDDATFTTYGVASVLSHVYVLPTNALFSVLTPSTRAFQSVCAYFRVQRDWFKLRRFTALNRFNAEVEHKLTPGMQRKSLLPCGRCGEPGHLSDALVCKHHVDVTMDGPTQLEVLRARDVARTARLAAIAVDARPPSLVALSSNGSSRLDRVLARLDAALGAVHRPF
ncbi:hypothetical protein SPRG_07695 [Saprolegnia parasitica CBS 223.65]|uniref:Uncharacterized protein n=1 Tax=Saprolegnia parasitica (strain CBS 223.65) TaxID=695850 RepID=A0A067CJI8_SAPPC|nr:hypothetical protein SPRG_07695 [Saprolegnia parasitica CBS 223.65]KDO26982.1 hypothetical protein SPRG_07695 [Saprolegnia parasitica CBS 223.65]|eukprot:XP_012202363.1 hypothetical protein SPRG_07695 [Saprolegnia parasitica CBS 223.65]